MKHQIYCELHLGALEQQGMAAVVVRRTPSGILLKLTALHSLISPARPKEEVASTVHILH